MESIEKLREYARELHMEPVSDAMLECAYEIESEIAEKYMELPVDADGVPIRVGDELCGYGLPDGGAIVKSLNGSMVIVGRLDGGENYAKSGLLWSANETRHYKPRTIEDVLREFTEKYQYCISDGGRAITLAKYADELRGMGVGE
jgi:hypothetical protein